MNGHTLRPPKNTPQIDSDLPKMMASIMDQNGLDDLILRDFVHDFYSKIRRDTVLGPILTPTLPIGSRI